MTGYTSHHGTYLAHRLTLERRDDDAFAKSLSTARVETKPHQVDAALFALQSPLSKGVILADEVGLGKAIEASMVIAQRWAERRRRILLIVPASLRKQWQQELREKFSLPSTILDARTYRDAEEAGRLLPFDVNETIILVSYEFAARRSDEIKRIPWDLVIFDEAHRLRNVYKKAGSARAKNPKDALAERFKILLTATPLQNSLMELYGLVSIVDSQFFGDETTFKTMYGGSRPDLLTLNSLKTRITPIYKRHLRRDVQEAGLFHSPGVCAERFRSLYLFKEHFEEVVWMGHSAKRLTELIHLWDANKTNGDEEFWQIQFQSHSFAFTQLFSVPVTLIEGKAYVGGQGIDRSDARFVDFLFSGGSASEAILIEIKTPVTPLIQKRPYRGNVHAASSELTGSVVQVADYRRSLNRDLDTLIRDGKYDLAAFNPKAVVIIGNSSELDNDKKMRSFQFFRSGLSDVEIVTFDELFLKIERLASLFN